MLKSDRDLIEAIRYDYLEPSHFVSELLNPYFSLNKTEEDNFSLYALVQIIPNHR